MFSKLKYILFDFSDNFKNDFLETLKKSISFLIVGLIAYAFINKADFVAFIAGIGLFGFGFIWGRNLTSALVDLSNLTSNVVLKWTIMLIMFVIGVAFGYLYFVWCLVKMIVVLIKGVSNK